MAYLMAYLFVSFSASSDASDLASILEPRQSGKFPLVQTAVILDGITNAYAVYPEFGRLPDSPGKDLFLGFRVSGSAKRVDARGRLKIFQNRGTSEKPRYEEGFWLDEKNPSARIPSGWSRGSFCPQLADFDGDGIVDLLSGSNCCAAFSFHWLRGLSDRSFGEMQMIRFQRTEVDPKSFPAAFARDITRPRVFDWNRDSKADLVMGTYDIRVDRNLRTFDVDTWLRTDGKRQQAKEKPDYNARNYLRTTDVAIPEFERLRILGHAKRRAWPVHVEFSDWDGDGNFDLLAIIESRVFSLRSKSGLDGKQEGHPEVASVRVWETHHTIVWLRNKTSTGEPVFAEALPLYQVKGNIDLQSFTAIDWDDDGSNEIVVSVTKNDPKDTMKVFDNTSKQLLLLDKP